MWIPFYFFLKYNYRSIEFLNRMSSFFPRHHNFLWKRQTESQRGRPAKTRVVHRFLLLPQKMPRRWSAVPEYIYIVWSAHGFLLLPRNFFPKINRKQKEAEYSFLSACMQRWIESFFHFLLYYAMAPPPPPALLLGAHISHSFQKTPTINIRYNIYIYVRGAPLTI